MTTEYLLEEQLDRVLAALTPSNELVCRVMLHTGLRIGDVLRLRPSDIRRQAWIVEQKTGKKKKIGFPDFLAEKILEQSNDLWAFPSPLRPDRPRTRQAVWKDVKRAAKAFRLPQNCGTHSMRKIYAVELMEKYGNIEKVQKALNHSSPSITIIYACADKLMEGKPKRHKYRS
jgi:integrase